MTKTLKAIHHFLMKYSCLISVYNFGFYLASLFAKDTFPLWFCVFVLVASIPGIVDAVQSVKSFKESEAVND